MQHDRGRGAGRGATVPSPLPAGAAVGMRAVSLWRRGMSVLLGCPGRMQGLKTQLHLLGRQGAPGSLHLLRNRLSCSGNTRGKGTLGVSTGTQKAYSHRHSHPPALKSPLTYFPRLALCIMALTGFPTPSLTPQPSMAPYCPEVKSRLPSLAARASHDLAQLTSLHP